MELICKIYSYAIKICDDVIYITSSSKEGETLFMLYYILYTDYAMNAYLEYDAHGKAMHVRVKICWIEKDIRQIICAISQIHNEIKKRSNIFEVKNIIQTECQKNNIDCEFMEKEII